MRQAPVVSICVPIYNGASYLRECLDSILAQTFPDFEVLIVDDQSTDESYEIAQRYASRDPRFRVMRNQHNLGLVGNWNQCVLLARGEWIKFLFQDDLLEAKCLERMLSVCRPDTSIVACKRKVIYEEVSKDLQERFERYIGRYNMDRVFNNETNISPESFCRAVLDNWFCNFIGEPTVVLLRRSVFSRFGFFNSQLIQVCDFEHWIRVASNTGIIYVPEFLASFRSHGKAASMVNLNSRKFRMYLDELICYHEFMFNPLYRPLRYCASQQQPPFDLKQWFAMKVKEMYKIAWQASKDHSNPDPSFLSEFTEIASLFPGFRIIKKLPFSLRFGIYKWKLRNSLSSHLGLNNYSNASPD